MSHPDCDSCHYPSEEWKGDVKVDDHQPRTENGDPAYLTASSCLDFFVKWMGAKEYGPKGSRALSDEDNLLWPLLDKMWAESPLLCLKLIFYKGDCRGGSKEKRLWLVSFFWLMDRHQAVAEKCLQHVPFFRYWKDLVKIAGKGPYWSQLVASLFYSQLTKDLDALRNPETNKGISLCAKWVPTEKSAGDRSAPLLLPSIRSLFGMDARQFRKTVTTPLRAHVKVVESFMCSQRWGSIEYSHVPSVAMNTYRKAFQLHDGERFAEWLQKLKSGDKSVKIQVGQLFPHTVAQAYLRGGAYDELTEQQWKALVEKTRALGTFDKALVVSDTSGSMSGVPMDVSVSLGVLISNSAKGAWKNILVNFDSNPAFHKLTGTCLRDDISTVRSVPWGGSTNLDGVFDILLSRAQEMEVPAEDMVTRIFILTDMQFNAACGGDGALVRAAEKFKAAGYQVPEIVCWNLRDSIVSVAAEDHTPGVCMLSGFSQDALKAVLKGGVPSPYQTMVNAVEDPRYDVLNAILL